MFEDAPEGIEAKFLRDGEPQIGIRVTSVLELRDDPRASGVERGNHHVVSGGRAPLTLS